MTVRSERSKHRDIFGYQSAIVLTKLIVRVIMSYYFILLVLVGSLLTIGMGVAILVCCFMWVRRSENVWTKSEIEEKKLLSRKAKEMANLGQRKCGTDQAKNKDAFVRVLSEESVTKATLHAHDIPQIVVEMTTNDAYADHTHNCLFQQERDYEQITSAPSEQLHIAMINNKAYSSVHHFSNHHYQGQ